MRPVTLALDNHASRFSQQILDAAHGEASKYGIRLFTEEQGTSGFLHALDQYNSNFHRCYNKARDAYKNAYFAHHDGARAIGGSVGLWLSSEGGVSTSTMRGPMQAYACSARRALGESLGGCDVSSAPASRQGLRVSVQAHPWGVCDGGGRGDAAPMTLSVLLVVRRTNEQTRRAMAMGRNYESTH